MASELPTRGSETIPLLSDRSCAVVAQSRWAVFETCPHCDGAMKPEHAHYRCSGCGWRDSCCD